MILKHHVDCVQEACRHPGSRSHSVTLPPRRRFTTLHSICVSSVATRGDDQARAIRVLNLHITTHDALPATTAPTAPSHPIRCSQARATLGFPHPHGLLNHILHSVPNGLRVQFSRDQDYDCVKIASPGPVSNVRSGCLLPTAKCR